MKKQGLSLLFLMVLLLLVSCGKEENMPKTEYGLYFLAGDAMMESDPHGPALVLQPWETEEKPNPGDLLQALLKGPEQEGLKTPFPRGLKLRGWTWSPEQAGVVQVRLTEQYSGLTDISLTLADYCIVLTLSQLDTVDEVEIISSGHSVNYRRHQILNEAEALLADPMAMGDSLS